jgi:deoxyribodipyrimidine photo-lyase
MPTSPIILWFRQDLRCADNPALSAAVETGQPIIPIYILDDDNADQWAMGGASRLWLHYSLSQLSSSLDKQLLIYSGDPQEIIEKLIQDSGASDIYWNRCYEPWRIKRDRQIKESYKNTKITLHSYNASLLWEPWDVLKKDGTPYRVFTPFYRNGCLRQEPPRRPLPPPEAINFAENIDALGPTDVTALQLIDTKDWSQIIEHWQIGEKSAHKKLEEFSHAALHNYKKGRDFPDQNTLSRLSPHLHFGEVSPNQAWYACTEQYPIGKPTEDLDHFKSELAWREFSYSLLYHFPDLPTSNFQKKFDHFPWQDDDERLLAWQRGQTGYPLVDAAMRELYTTGYMHNRCRMVVASFLVKNLLIHWHKGAEWFWDCLFDADLASNSASWQWVAGCGADAAPYFRIFNPVTQSRKFVPNAEYIKKYVPELRHVPSKLIHEPWTMSTAEQAMYDVKIGKDYPAPIIDIKSSREFALMAYAHVRNTISSDVAD